MCIWDSNCIWYIMQLQDSESFKDIYRESNDKWLLVSICIWDSDEFLGYAMNIE